jgi:galactose mutarotase-like enzyme
MTDLIDITHDKPIADGNPEEEREWAQRVLRQFVENTSQFLGWHDIIVHDPDDGLRLTVEVTSPSGQPYVATYPVDKAIQGPLLRRYSV